MTLLSLRAEDVEYTEEYFSLGGRLIDREKVLYASHQRRYFIFSLLMVIELLIIFLALKYGVQPILIGIFLFLLVGMHREWKRRAVAVLNILDVGNVQIYGLKDEEAQLLVANLNEANL